MFNLLVQKVQTKRKSDQCDICSAISFAKKRHLHARMIDIKLNEVEKIENEPFENTCWLLSRAHATPLLLVELQNCNAVC